MKKEFSARHLDVLVFARTDGVLTGQEPLSAFNRLKQEAQGPLEALTVTWSAHGEMRPVDGGPDEVWLHVLAQTRLPLVCQRCMAPVDTQVVSDRWFRFAPDEATAAVLDEASEEDVLVLSGTFDLHELVEDELLMRRQRPRPALSLSWPAFGWTSRDSFFSWAIISGFAREIPRF